uniref:Uncharacterized protein n=1 Tax=Meloidogyne enterolobii TaxID=390850 RepID=A0A6V7V485_MELEN|nr:unnamed protein product [Meloidogyne enterolobii]
MGSINGERNERNQMLFPFSITSRSLQMTASSTSEKVLPSRPVSAKGLGWRGCSFLLSVSRLIIKQT